MSSPSSATLSRLPYKARVLSGLSLANDTTDQMNDLVIQPGFACDDEGIVYYVPTQLIKRLDANFSAGNNGGILGLTLSKAANTDYHIFVIRNANNVTDIYADTSTTGANKPAGWFIVCRIASLYTNSAAPPNSAWVLFTQYNDFFALNVASQLVIGNSTSAQFPVVAVPKGFRFEAVIGARPINASATGLWGAAVFEFGKSAPPIIEDIAGFNNGSYEYLAINELRVLTDTLGRIVYLASATNSATARLTTKGWYDLRGRNA